MERSSRSSRALPLLMGLGLLATGCSLEQPPTTPEPSTPLYVDGAGKMTSLSGFSWDPEAFFFSLVTCGGPACPIPPLLGVGIPHYERSLIRGASVSIFDPMTGTPAGNASGPTADDGSWQVPRVASRGEVPYFAFGVDGSLPPEGPDGFGGGFLPPIPATPGYLPTLTLQPIFTDRSTACFFQQSPQLGSTGILEATAKYLTATGKPTQVSDFLDPSKVGGVVVWWSFSPGPPFMRMPALQSSLEVGGEGLPADTKVLSVLWAPPGGGPPDLQSARGFFVAEEGTRVDGVVKGPASFFGISVAVFPPSSTGAPHFATFQAARADGPEGPPLAFGPVGTPVPSGVISFVGTQIFPLADPSQPGPPPDEDPTPNWLCLPPG